LAAALLLTGAGPDGERDTGRIVGSGAAETTPSAEPSARGERSAVPDACTLVGDALAGRLAPGAARNPADAYQAGDRQNQCVWGAYTGDRGRQLSVELRAVAGTAGQSPARAAATAFASERRDDESGRSLLAGRRLIRKSPLEGIGDEGYVVYSVDEDRGSGEAIASVRAVNVLVTIHYSGSDDGGPLAEAAATGGAEETAKAVLKALEQG
ncbi:hypothetical protein, partial [Actinomadura roseirufa]|uniref:hypothetical protein n=1 Tax=Actinomadura roseirufa TaxID=2094049 RepID=UPI001A955FCB